MQRTKNRGGKSALRREKEDLFLQLKGGKKTKENGTRKKKKKREGSPSRKRGKKKKLPTVKQRQDWIETGGKRP